MGGAKEEGAEVQVIERDEGASGVGHLIILAVGARDSGRVSGIQELPLPHGENEGGIGASRHLPHCLHELDQPRPIAHRVVKTHREDESPAIEASHLTFIIT